jgi:hypothetical protein
MSQNQHQLSPRPTNSPQTAARVSGPWIFKAFKAPPKKRRNEKSPHHRDRRAKNQPILLLDATKRLDTPASNPCAQEALL